MPRSALIVIDIQNDYFPTGRFPLWDADATLARCLAAISWAKAGGMPVVLVQHVVPAGVAAPLLQEGTPGVELHPLVRSAAPDAPVIVKRHADAFHETRLAAVLTEQAVDHLLICGMMTQNCVTHTALSRAADRYSASILGDCCTTVSEILHRIALNAISTRLTVCNAANTL